jgi:hypothetical protein
VYITDVVAARGDDSPPFPQWLETTRSINPECDWGEDLVVNGEVNPGSYSTHFLGIDRRGNNTGLYILPDLCVGVEGITCQFSETAPGQPNQAWGRVGIEADGGVVSLSGECQSD